MLQGYRALLAWREAAGREFEIRRLVDVLRSCSMDDVADVAVSLLDGKSLTSHWHHSLLLYVADTANCWSSLSFCLSVCGIKIAFLLAELRCCLQPVHGAYSIGHWCLDGWMSVCCQLFSYHYFYSFYQILTKLWHTWSMCQYAKLWNRFWKLRLKIFSEFFIFRIGTYSPGQLK